MHYILTLLLPLITGTAALVWQIRMAEKKETVRNTKNNSSNSEKKDNSNKQTPVSKKKENQNEEGLNVSNDITYKGKPFLNVFEEVQNIWRVIQFYSEVVISE
jgi:hypothetical protein